MVEWEENVAAVCRRMGRGGFEMESPFNSATLNECLITTCFQGI